MQDLKFKVTGSNHSVRREGNTIIVEDTEELSPITLLVTALKNDKGYYQSWKANIAMAFQDNLDWHLDKHNKSFKEEVLSEVDFYSVSNKSAEHFLKQLTDE